MTSMDCYISCLLIYTVKSLRRVLLFSKTEGERETGSVATDQ